MFFFPFFFFFSFILTGFGEFWREIKSGESEKEKEFEKKKKIKKHKKRKINLLDTECTYVALNSSSN